MPPVLPALLLAAVSCAADLKAPAPVSLHPLLLGDPSAMGGPLTGALAAQAAALTKHGPLPAASAAALLEPALKSAIPAERAAALVAAKLMADRGAAEAFLAGRPQLGPGPVAALKGLAYAQDAYRGSPNDPRTALGMLSVAAASDPAVAWLFDGSQPGLELEGLVYKGRKVSGPSGSFKARGDGMVKLAPHPGLPGAVLLLGDERALLRERQFIEDLAQAAAGPRWLGAGKLMNAKGRLELVGVREAVLEGRTLRSLADEGRYGPAEQSLVLDLIARLARARLKVTGLGPESVVIGHTGADPRPRAFVVGASAVELWPEGVDEGRAWELLLEEPVFIAIQHAVDGELLLPPSEIWRPFREFLYGQVRQPRLPLGQRLRGWLRLKP